MSKCLGDGLTLRIGPRRQDVDDGLLISTEALHGSPERRRILCRVKVGDTHDGWVTLIGEKHKLNSIKRVFIVWWA